LAAATGLFAQNLPTPELRNVVQLSSSGTVEVQQDLLTLTLSVTKEGSDAAQVQAQLRQATESALAEAKKAASAGAMEVRTGAFGLQPRYGRDGKINGWQGSSELVLEGRDFARIGTTAGKIQTLTISNAGFSLSRELRAKAEAEAQGLAIERFKTKATDIARGFGFAAYALREVSINANDQGFFPRQGAMAMALKSSMADAPVPMEAGKSAVVVSVSGTVQLK
jgi:predicted secreted protein